MSIVKYSKLKERNKPTVIDLFCGCGGLSKGFLDAGFEVLLGVDNDKPSLETYKKNIISATAEEIDLFNINFVSQIKNIIQNKNVDVIVGGPPCQGFSLTGTRNFDDKRNRLYLAVFDAVKAMSPKAFVIENVKGMKTLYGGTVKDEIVKRFTSLGYTVTEPKILSSADYGVPQIRERLFFVGVRDDLGKFEFPTPTHYKDTYITCEAALSDLPSRSDDFGEEIDSYTHKPKSAFQKYMRLKAKRLHNHVATKHTELVKSVIRLVPEGGNYKDLPEGVGTSRRFNEAWTRYHSQKPSRTIDTGHSRNKKFIL